MVAVSAPVTIRMPSMLDVITSFYLSAPSNEIGTAGSRRIHDERDVSDAEVVQVVEQLMATDAGPICGARTGVAMRRSPGRHSASRAPRCRTKAPLDLLPVVHHPDVPAGLVATSVCIWRPPSM